MQIPMIDKPPKKTVIEWLNTVSYSDDPNYIPSDFALDFVTFIKLVNGTEGEENLTPTVHYHMLDNVAGKRSKTINLCHRGMAKALSLDSQIVTPKGNVTMRDIKIGDELFTRDGTVTTVTHKSEIFNKPMYVIELEDGRTLAVSEDHLNIVQKRRTGKRSLSGFSEKVLTTQELIESGVTYVRQISDRNPKGYETKWYVPTGALVEYAKKNLPIDPYTIGAILGDGSIAKDTGFTRFHTHEDDLNHFLSTLEGASKESVRSDSRRESTKRFSLKGMSKQIKQFIGTENVYGKRIPQELLWASSEQRLACLRGLMDTDGSTHNGSSSFCTVSEGLANDVLWLARSLGFEAKVGKSTGYFKVYIYADVCPFLLERKAVKWKPNKKDRIGIKTIKPIPECESQCIAVADGSHSFLAESFFVTHNTTVLGEYLFLYIACYGELPEFGRVSLALYVSDSVENGVKNMRKNLEHRWENSEFLQKYVPHAKFTDLRWEFKNVEGKKLIIKGYGAKALSLETTLYTETGTTTIGEVQVGDKIYGNDGKLAKVTKKSEVFNKPMYEIQEEDGRTLKVSEDHLNPVVIKFNPNNKAEYEERVLSTLDLLEQPLQHVRERTRKGKPNYTSKENLVFVENPTALKYSQKKFSVDPYTLGVVLGDGRIRKECGSVELTAHQDEFPHYYEHIPYEFGSYRKDPRSNAATQAIRGLGKHLKAMDLNVRGELKFIPEDYFYGSIEQRLSLVQGLMDTDGTVDTKGRTTFSSASHQLCDDLAMLVRSLGGSAKFNKCGTANAYRIEIWMEFNCFKLQRKADRFKPRSKRMAVTAIKEIQQEPSQCIAIDNESRQFVADAYFPTHNTGVRGAKEMGTRPVLAVLDDLLSDEDAKSPTITENVEATVFKAVEHALLPSRKKVIWSGTPFNAKDPLYKAVESGGWWVNVYPVCEQFPVSREEFRGSWPDRFTYDFVLEAYEFSLANGRPDTFNQELMLRIMSDDERLVTDGDILWYERTPLIQNKDNFNYYITTDFATSERNSADYSVISVWAYSSNGDWFWVDGICKRMTMDKNINELFRLVQKWKPMEVGIEVSGQQGGFVSMIQREMHTHDLYFNLASDSNGGRPGIRPNLKKIDRFNTVLPLFKSNKIYFPLEMKDTFEMRECMEELTLVSRDGFKSKHDDFSDTISMLSVLNAWKPSGNVRPHGYDQDTDMWGWGDEDEEDFGTDSYVV